MRRTMIRCALLLLAALLMPFPSNAARPSEPGQLLAAQTGCWFAQPGKRADVPRMLVGCDTSVDAKAAPESAARAVLADLSPLLGLRRDGRDLTLLKADRAQGVSYVRFQQVHGGVPVYLGQVLVQYDRAGAVQLINNHTLPHLALDTTPAIAQQTALEAAYAAIPGAGALYAPIRQELVIYAEHGAPELAWHIVLPLREPLGEWSLMISATTGTLLGRWNQLQFDSGTGHIHHPNPIQTTGDRSLTDNNDAASTALNNARVSVTLNNLNSNETRLKGSAADLTPNTGSSCELPYTPGTASEPSRIYSYTRDDDRFEEVNVYAAIDGVQTWFQVLGFPNVNNRPTPVDVHCFPYDGAFYSTETKMIVFGDGDGGVDTAEDADVVVHEYGHAVQHNQIPGLVGGLDTEQMAMAEGFGDFLAGMYYVSAGHPTYLSTHRYCIAEWMMSGVNAPASGCLRWINGQREGFATPNDIGVYRGTPTQVHNDGRYWSAALTCVYEGLGANAAARDKVMSIVLAHHFSMVPTQANTAFEDAVLALVMADKTYHAGANELLIQNCARSRGLVDDLPMFSPTLTAPGAGSSYQAGTPLQITWQTNDAPSHAVYVLEYTRQCTIAPTLSETAEGGPNGWTVAHNGGTDDWAIVTTDAHSGSSSWFAGSVNDINDQYLISPNITLGSRQILSFWHRYAFERGSVGALDGGVVEISTNGGTNWVDLGPRMIQNTYTFTINQFLDSPIAGRPAFSGISDGWIETRADLSSYAGQAVKIRFRQADDWDGGWAGWWVDDIKIVADPIWRPLATSAPGATSYDWTAPAINGTDYCIRIHGEADRYQNSGYAIIGPFAVTGGAEQPPSFLTWLPLTRR